jgi:hypothetical protein
MKVRVIDVLPDMTEEGSDPTTGEAYVQTHKYMINTEMEFIIA